MVFAAYPFALHRVDALSADLPRHSTWPTHGCERRFPIGKAGWPTFDDERPGSATKFGRSGLEPAERTVSKAEERGIPARRPT